MSFPEQPFGFVAGRWVLSIGDTPDDADRAPDYVPVKDGAVVFTPQVTHRVATDGSGWAGIIKDRVMARVGERGQLVDAEGHDHLALAVGVYSVSYDFGLDRSWPSHYIEVKQEHTAEAPLWLPPIAPAPEGPMIENRVVTIPADGEDGQVLVWDGAGFSWDYPPTGPQGPKGDLDAEQLAGAPRLTNEAHDMEWISATDSNSIIDAQTDRLVKFTATAQNGYIRGDRAVVAGAVYYLSTGVKTTSDRVSFGVTAPAYHSGSGDWERLSEMVTPSLNTYYLVRDRRPSGWDQIEVRDPVLINLTEVFGAGREPSKEYMDALMANHNNYIGGVDQFAVGDALHALTLAGQGMGIRVDNSVGTRVLLDHPGGSTMLYGDTGRRDIYNLTTTGTWDTPTGVNQLILSRIGNIVYLEGRLVRTTATAGRATGAETLFTAPDGFKPHRYSIRGVANVGTNVGIVTTFSGASRIEIAYIPGQWAVGDILAVSASWRTIDPWPTVLPGEPA